MIRTQRFTHCPSQSRRSNPILHGIVALVACAALLLSCRMNAQSTNGEVTGTVTDQSGNVVPGALVTITDTARGVAFKAMTNDAGVYHISLPIGNYKAQVTKTGFETLRESAFDLELGQTDRLDFTLKVGAATEIVEVGPHRPLRGFFKSIGREVMSIVSVRTAEKGLAA